MIKIMNLPFVFLVKLKLQCAYYGAQMHGIYERNVRIIIGEYETFEQTFFILMYHRYSDYNAMPLH